MTDATDDIIGRMRRAALHIQFEFEDRYEDHMSAAHNEFMDMIEKEQVLREKYEQAMVEKDAAPA
jgi:hypothetical protein